MKFEQKYSSWYHKYHIVIAYSLGMYHILSDSSIGNNLGFSQYGPIWGSAAVYYGLTDPNDLQWLGNMYYLTYFSFSLITAKLLINKIHYALYLGTFFNTLGTWTVWIAANNYAITIVGYFLVGVGQSFFNGLPIYLGDVLFKYEKRGLITSITSLGMTFSTGIALTYSSFYYFNVTSQEVINDQISTMNLLVAIFNTIGLIYSVLFVRYQKGEQIQEGLIKQVRSIMSSQDILLDLLTFGVCKIICKLVTGLGWCYLTLLQIQTSLNGFTPFQQTICPLMFQWTGGCVGIVFGIILDAKVKAGKQPNLDVFIKYVTSIGTFLMIIEAFTVHMFNQYILDIINILIGVGILSTYQFQLQSISEKYYPLSSVILVKLVNFFANMVAVCLTYIMFLPMLQRYSLMILIYLITPFQLYVMMFYNTKYRRYELAN